MIPLLLFAPVLILLVADMWLWPTMGKMFHISELIAQRRDGTAPQADASAALAPAEEQAAQPEVDTQAEEDE